MFEPKSEKELQSSLIWEAGDYDFDVTGSVRKKSKSSGKNMLEITLSVFHPDGRSQQVKDWLVESDAPLCLLKLRHYCRSLNAIEAYESGDLGSFPGAGSSGRCKLRVDMSEQYGAQNRVSDYLVPVQAPQEMKQPEQVAPTNSPPPNKFAAAGEVPPDEEIPF